MQIRFGLGELLENVSAGHYREARRQLFNLRNELQSADADRWSLLSAELNLAEGSLRAAQSGAESLLVNTRENSIRIDAHRILAEVFAQRLEYDVSLKHYDEAKQLAKNDSSAEQAASVTLSFWRTFSAIFPLEATEVDFATVRRTIIKGGVTRHLIELHLCAARIEARKGGLLEARRHWDIALALLRTSDSPKIKAQLELDGCMLSLLGGDLQCAFESSVRAEQAAQQAGYFRGELAALIDRAHIYHALGQLEEARRVAIAAEKRAVEHSQLRVAALDCLTNVLISMSDVAGAEATIEQISHLKAHLRNRTAFHWDVLSELSSRISLEKLKNRLNEAIALVNEAVEVARISQDKNWLARMQLELAELKLATGSFAEAKPLVVSAIAHSSNTPELLARVSRTVALTALAENDTAKASANYRRSLCIATSIESKALGVELATQDLELDDQLAGNSFEDATALIELAGYPHVLAREGFELLEVSGAAKAQALIARGTGIRCIATRTWTEGEAVAVAKTPGDRLQIVCGVHRDESWEIIAAPKPELHHRAAAIALQKLVETAVTLDRYRREEKQRAALWPADTMETDGGLWVSEQMIELLGLARRVASSPITVLLTGETGTGKEVLARAIHRASPRAAKPFVPFNCAAVPRDMLESQLFGYRKGAFTGADTAFDGVIRGAAGGTLFLDEITEIGPELQPKLLRFLETHEVHGLGEPQPISVDVRVIAATNADVNALVRDGRFREDLLYRLDGVRLRLPPLRERREEIPPLIDYYLRKFADEQTKGRLSLDDETLEYLVLYGWPGNVRQLVNEIRRMVTFAEPDGRLAPALLSPDIQASRRTVRVLPGDEPEIRIRLDQSLSDAVDTIERVMIRRALERAHGNYENAARLLGISRKGLFLKRRRWGLERAS